MAVRPLLSYRVAVMGAALCVALTSAAHAQDAVGDDEFQTGIDAITIQPLEEGQEIGGFTPEFTTDGIGGLSLEELQSLPDDAGFQRELLDITTQTQETVASAGGATLRFLDRLTGRVEDVEIPAGQAAKWGFMTAAVADCRFPVGNPAGDAYAFVTVEIDGITAPVFQGWMVASSPALNAMDHARYDVWPLACSTS